MPIASLIPIPVATTFARTLGLTTTTSLALGVDIGATAAFARAPAHFTTTSARPEALPKLTAASKPVVKTATYPKPTAVPKAIPVTAPMSEAQLRLKMRSMSREQLARILVQSSHSSSPSDTSVSRLMVDTVPFENQVEMFIDAVTTFENRLKGFSSGMDLTELVEYGEESTSIMERVIGKIVREIGKAMDLDVDENGNAVQIWADGMLALSRIAIVLADCTIPEVTTSTKVQVLDRIVDDMLRLISMISRFTIGVTPAQLTTMTHIRAQITRLRTVSKKGGIYRFELVLERYIDVFGHNGELGATGVSVTHLTVPKPPF